MAGHLSWKDIDGRGFCSGGSTNPRHLDRHGLPGSLPFVGRVTSAVVDRYDMDSAVRGHYLMWGKERRREPEL